MFRPAFILAALALATAGSPALAAPTPEPMMLTDAQLDAVTAGEGLLTIVLQDSFNNLTFNVGGTKGGGNAAAKASEVPGNGAAKGWENGHNPHSASAQAAASSSTQNNTMVFQVNLISNVNGAIAGGDASAGQVVGTQTLALTPTRH